MTDDQRPTVPSQPPPSPDDVPLAASAAPPAPGMRDAMSAWSDLDQSSKLIIGGSAAAVLVTIVGLPLGVWGSTDFVLMVLAASIVAGLAAGLRTGEILATQLGLLELGAGSVLGVLGVWNLIETLFDLDHPRGDLLGIILAVALAAAGIAVLVGGVRRLDDPRALVMHGQWTKVTAIGFALVLAGWTLNLTISYWTMGQAGLSLAVLTLAALIIVVSDRIDSPIPAAWAGVVLAHLRRAAGPRPVGRPHEPRPAHEPRPHGLPGVPRLRGRDRRDHRRRRHDGPRRGRPEGIERRDPGIGPWATPRPAGRTRV